MAQRFASAVITLRYVIVAGWIAAAVVAAVALPTIGQSQTGSFGDLVPLGADAIEAEERSARLFAFPLSSRTLVVERDPDGLSSARLAATARRAIEVNRGELPRLEEAAGAYGLTNAIPRLSFAREKGTTAFTALLFEPGLGPIARTNRGNWYEEALDAPQTSFTGVTGVIPARRATGQTIVDRLPVVELATVILVALTVGLYLRSFVAPVVTLVTVAVAYLLAVRLIAVVGGVVDVSVPAEVEPVLVVLLFGVVTDYALFFMSRFRALVGEGAPGREAARRTTAELTPIVVTCGFAVAAGSAALAAAELGFLKAFGPGMAIAVLIGLVVVVTLLPAFLAILGGGLFWPSTPRRAPARLAGGTRTTRLIARAVARPKATVAVSLLLVAAMGSGVLWLQLGNPIIRGLPDDAEAHAAYTQLTRGFAPGVASPATLIVEADGVAERRAALRSLQQVLADQPGIAGVIGPATQPARQAFGAVLSRTGDAARYVLIASDDPLGAAAIRRQRNLQERIGDLFVAVGLENARASFAGDTALAAETLDGANDDLLLVLPLVLLAVALVLAIFLRALLAPLYLVLLAALAPLAALGLTVAFFQGVLGQPELTYFVPIVAGVLLISLGSDYNVFIAGSIWAEARRRPLREAVVAGGGGAAHAIAAAGIVLAASFAALGLVPIQAFRELAFVLAAGLLVDAFLIRLVIAPAVIVLVEGRRARPAPQH